jgi:cell division protein FtsI/penicillin-binding protein 2
MQFRALIPHTLWVRGMLRSAVAATAVAVVSAACLPAQKPGWESAVEQTAHAAPEARIVVLDLRTGRLLAARRLDETARTLAAPGSTLKPLILYGLLAAGRWDPERRVSCSRRLTIAGHRLDCTHPPGPPFDAREALTWSCNSYFAEVARTLGPGELGQLLRPTGLLGITGLAPEEATAEFREPHTIDDAQLAFLGVEGVRITPLELAAAYRWLALALAAHSGTDASQVVRAGLQDSASFGMAGQASLGGVPVLGKTGTAEGTASSRTHGWFAGIAPAGKPQVVVVVYLPAGRGADAARVAGELLTRAPMERP